jgi:hypothetical protein
VKETLAVIAALLAVAGNVPYLRDIYKARVEPHAYTWFVWTLVSGITLAGQIVKGAGVGALPTAVAWVFTFIIFLYSLRYGLKHITRTDTVFLVIALFGLIPWALTRDPTVSVIVAVGIDLVAFIPTLRKTWQQPHTETPMLYGMNVARHVLALFALEAYNISTTLHSIAMIIMNSLMTSIILMRRNKNHEE